LASDEIPSAATLHEAYGRRGALPSQIKPLVRGLRVAGLAVTVRCPPGDNLRLHEAIYEAEPGQVLVVDVGDGYEFGYWGEITTVAASSRSLGGLVINGGVRDCEQIEKIGFPVFARCVCVRGTVKDPRAPGSVNQPVVIGDVAVYPGDLVVGDDDGVVVIAADQQAEVIEAARRRDLGEQESLARIRGGERTIDRIRSRLGQ
jgi:4-hydroxy-4-methyl-2-oxoglutarate aldolase